MAYQQIVVGVNVSLFTPPKPSQSVHLLSGLLPESQILRSHA
nr:MAG TPA: hypothetical protein [Caudoviricetes sp.]